MLPLFDRSLVRFNKIPLISRYYSRAFGKTSRAKVVVVYHPNRISYSQVYPFHFFSRQFSQRFGAEFRFCNYFDVLSGADGRCANADVVLFQSWFNVSEPELASLISKIKTKNPTADLHFLDSFAPTDLRLGKWLEPEIKSYVKKTYLTDRSVYQRGVVGGTNLAEFYSSYYALDEDLVDWATPQALFPKLRLSPTFMTGPGLIEPFMSGKLPVSTGRTIDLHARLATHGSAWYGSMRIHAEKAALSLKNLNIVTGGGVSRKQFMKELGRSKACFSPFGYGEICWRDIEAIIAGSVLIKPDMGHLDMSPALHVPGETYVSIKWDYSDLEEKMTAILSDEAERLRISQNAFNLVRDYIQQSKFVEQFAYLFE